jgi:hypothetical protein
LLAVMVATPLAQLALVTVVKSAMGSPLPTCWTKFALPLVLPLPKSYRLPP